ncbi:MAG: SRPBCC family protein [Terriglobales bacterium]
MSIHLEYSTTAKCRPEHIWKKFEALDQWAWWNKVISRARWVEGQPWQKGSRFEMELARPKPMKFRPVIIESAPPTRVAWVGKGSGFTGEHWFSFELQPDGATLMKTWEEFSGISTLFFGNGTRQGIVKMHQEWLEALKFEAERIAREAVARS